MDMPKHYQAQLQGRTACDDAWDDDLHGFEDEK